MTANRQFSTQQLMELIRAKHGVLLQLREQSVLQAEMIEQNNMDGLLSVLSIKQSLIEHLHHLENELGPFRDQDPEQRQWASLELRAHTQRTATECDQLLQEVMSLDQNSEQVLQQRRDHVAERLTGLHAAAVASQGYQAGSETSGRHLDVSS